MQKLILSLAALFGLALVASGIFILGREIGMEGRVTAQPVPLVTPVQVANTGEGGGGMPEEPQATPIPDYIAVDMVPTLQVDPTSAAEAAQTLQNSAPEGCQVEHVDLRDEDQQINVPFPATLFTVPRDSATMTSILILQNIGGGSPVAFDNYAFHLIQEGSESGDGMFYGIWVDYHGGFSKFLTDADPIHVPPGEYQLGVFDVFNLGGQSDQMEVFKVRHAINRSAWNVDIYLCPQ